MGIYRQARKGQKQPKRLELGNFATISYQFRAIIDEFRRVKYDHKPRFDSMFMRKLFCLFYLESIEKERGYFTAKDIHRFYLDQLPWAKNYFDKLIVEGWIVKMDVPTARTTYVGSLSALWGEFVQLLRRRLDVVSDELDPNKVDGLAKNSKLRKEILAKQAKAIPPVPKPYPLEDSLPAVVEESLSKACVKSQANGQSDGGNESDDLFADFGDNR